MIQAVIFDCFGVLTTDGWKQIREMYFAQDSELLQRSLDMDKAVNVGMTSYDEFLKEISDMTGLSYAEVNSRLNGKSPNTQLFDYIRRELKPHYKIGMLSNAADNWLTELFEPDQVALFDEAVLSYQVGMVKPEPAMYEQIATKLGVLPENCLFIDDSERYCTAAKETGMEAIWHQDTAATIEQIREKLYA